MNTPLTSLNVELYYSLMAQVPFDTTHTGPVVVLGNKGHGVATAQDETTK